MNLDDTRKRIDDLDARLVQLLNERAEAARDIGQAKAAEGASVYVPAREQAVLERVTSINPGPLPEHSVRAIYREIISASTALESTVRIAYLGPPATFTHQAARARFGASVEYLSCETIGDVFGMVEKRTAEYGVVPIENSTEGAVTHTLDRFVETPLRICAEIYLPISHNLMAQGERGDIRRIYSNPQVFGQCRGWLQENMRGVDLVPVSSTARAAEQAAREPESAAMAGLLAAELYGLKILDRDVQDRGGNTTRFLVIARQFGPASGKDRTSLLFSLRHEAGALYRAISVFNEHGISMSKIESRPSRLKAWEYYFFVDIDGHAEDQAVQTALAELARQCTELTVLGSYPQAIGREG